MRLSLLAHLGLLFVSLNYWFTGIVFAQSLPNPAPPAIIPPTPVAQELQRFLGYAVNGATGAADVSIPLYTLEIPGLTIPFALRCNTSGIKVRDEVGTLGYGWSLFPGLRITRTVMGKADDLYDTGNINQYNLNNDYRLNLATSVLTSPVYLDGQPDIFTLHLPNLNGSFVLQSVNGQLSAVTIPHEPLDITPVRVGTVSAGTGRLWGFEVRDAKGIRYVFGTHNPAPSLYPSASEQGEYLETGAGITTSWMLRSIILPGGNEVTLHYQTATNLVYTEPSTDVVDNVAYDNGRYAQDTQGLLDGLIGKLGASWGGYTVTPSNGNYNREFPPTQCLSSLIFNGGNIIFSYRNPNSANMRLNSFTVSAGSQPIRTVSFTSNTDNTLLKQVAISGTSLSETQRYTFDYYTYNQTGFGTAADQDWWGYYNAAGNPGSFAQPPQLSLILLYGYGGGLTPIPGANRNPNAAAMQVNSLRQVTYPTGGYARFTYEPHALGLQEFSPGNVYSVGGGLRVNQIEVFDPVASKTIVKTYTYGAIMPEDGKAVINYPMNQDNFIDEKFLFATPCTGCAMFEVGSSRLRTISTTPRYGFLALTQAIWYHYVTEYSDGGKTEYQYEYSNDDWGPAGGSHLVQVPAYLRNIRAGAPALIRKMLYKNTGPSTYLLQQKVDNIYGNDEDGRINGLLVEITAYNQDMGGNPLAWNDYYFTNRTDAYGLSMQMVAHDIFRIAPYQIATGRRNLGETTLTEYNPDGTTSFVRTSSNTYDQTYPFNLTATKVSTSNGPIVHTAFYYPTSPIIPGLNGATPAWLTALQQNNRLTEVVEKAISKGLRPLSRQLTSYRTWAPGILEPEAVSTALGTAAYEPRLRYYDYDAKGNVLSVGQEHDGRTSYVWGYQPTLLIAEVKNALNSQVAFTSFEADSPGGWTYDNSFVTAAFTGRRGYGLGTTSAATVSRAGLAAGAYELHLWAHGTGVPQVSGGIGAPAHTELAVSGDWHHHRYTVTLPANATLTISTPGYIWLDEVRLHPLGARMVSYTHEPLVGMTSQTGPDGRTLFYEYDGLGRLVRTRDEQQRILGQQQYHYAGQ